MIGLHIVFSAYRFWLPNDPRGSWSTYVGSREIYEVGGKATKTGETASVAKLPHDRDLRIATKSTLKYPPVKYTGLQARAIARGFASYAQKSRIAIWACAVMPDHLHLCCAPGHLNSFLLGQRFKAAATQRLNEEDLHPFKLIDGNQQKCFAAGQWVVYLDTYDDVHRTISYIEQNPVKAGLPSQKWGFVEPYC